MKDNDNGFSSFDNDIIKNNSEDSHEVSSTEDVNYIVDNKRKKSRQLKVIFLVVVFAVLALLIGGYLGIQNVVDNAYQNNEEEGPEAPIDRLPQGEEPITVEDGVNVLSSVFEGDTEPYEGEEEIELGNDRFIFSGSQLMLEVDNGEFIESQSVDCSLVDNTDICYAGYVEMDDLDDVDVYAVKNIIENRLFESMDNVQNTTIRGASVAIIGNIVIDNDEEITEPILALSGENGSGFFIMFRPNSENSLEDFGDYSSEFEIHN